MYSSSFARGSQTYGPCPGQSVVELELAQPPQRVEVGRQRPLPRRDEDGTGAEHGVAREAEAGADQADAVGRVPRGREHAERADLVALAGERDRHPEVLGALGVVGVRMGEDDALRIAADGLPHGRQVLVVGGPGVDDPALEYVRVGAVEGEGGGVVGPHADDAVGVAL